MNKTRKRLRRFFTLLASRKLLMREKSTWFTLTLSRVIRAISYDIKITILAAVIILGSIMYYAFAETDNALSAEVTQHELFALYEQNFNYELLAGTTADFDEDGRSDLLVIFSYTKDSNKMIVILNKESGAHITEMLPAPIENIEIEIKDIDKEPPVEFIISGSKNNNFGYGIYRIADDEIFDIFGADMRDCC